MANLVEVRGTSNIAALDDLPTGLGAVAQSISSGGGDPYLRMGKDGIWIYGAENVEVQKGSLWAVHPLSVEHGLVCWTRHEDGGANQKLGEVMVPSNQPVPVRSTLPDHGFPWVDQVGFTLVCTNGEDKGTQVKYSATSKGGLAEIKNTLLNSLIAQIAKEKQNGPLNASTSKIVPVVELNHSSYTHKAYGKIYTPVFSIRGWGTLEDQSIGEAPAPKGPVSSPAGAAEAPRTRSRGRVNA